MKTLKRIVPGSLAKMLGLLYGLLGVIIGLVILVVTLITVAFGHTAGWFGLIAVIFFPIMYGLLGLILGYISALLYNFVAKRTGGVQFEVE